MANIQDCPGFEPFGEDVKAARKNRRLSRQKAAEMAGISTVYLINIENNHIIPALPVIGDAVFALLDNPDKFVVDGNALFLTLAAAPMPDAS